MTRYPTCSDCIWHTGSTSSVGRECMQPDNQRRWTRKKRHVGGRTFGSFGSLRGSSSRVRGRARSLRGGRHDGRFDKELVYTKVLYGL